MKLLFDLISDESKNAQAAWNLLFRLPIYDQQMTKRNSRFELRYWLYLQDYLNSGQLDAETFTKVATADD